MRKYIITSAVYGVLGLAAGVFYREFTKLNSFTERTMLGMVHPHFLGLGMLFFLVIGLLAGKLVLENYKTYKAFFCVYNTGVVLTGILMLIRGVLEVQNVSLSKGSNTAVTVVAGVAHMIVAAGLVLLFISLFKATKSAKAKDTAE